MQTKLEEEDAKLLYEAADIIQGCFHWNDTDEGVHFWGRVVELLRNKASNRTSDGKPWVDPEPPIPDGWRMAEADEWTRKDVKYWDLYEKDWRPRLSQGTEFDPPVMQTHYIVPIDPPLTDEDACVWPRRWVMVRDESDRPWEGPFQYVGKDKIEPIAPNELPYLVWFSNGYGWYSQARRATPAEIEAAK